MKINCSFDFSLTFGRYIFEASFWAKDWDLAARVYNCSAIRMVHIGPVCFAITNLKKLKECYETEPQPVSLDDFADL